MKSFLPYLKKFLLAISVVVLVFAASILIVRFYNEKSIEIKGESGVQEDLFIEIGEINQYIQIRGQNVNNPIILILHGGPGNPMSFYSYIWQRELEENYTIVNWDQRGSGRTYFANEDKSNVKVTTQQLLRDLNELVDYLRLAYNKDKVIILGHSWGTVLGTLYVADYSEKVESYIGVGQVVTSESETLAVDKAIELAEESGDFATALDIRTKHEENKRNPNDFNKLMEVRRLTFQYLPSGENMPFIEQLWRGLTSPQMNWEDFKWYYISMFDTEKYLYTEKNLLNYISEGKFNLFESSYEYNIPMYFVSGDEDWVTPFVQVEKYSELVNAPTKKFIAIDGVGHFPFTDRKKAEFIRIINSLSKNP